jgi:Tfp pilus assembly protein PilP
MALKLDILKEALAPVWVGLSIFMFAPLLPAQDEIDEPAGDIAAASEDSEADTEIAAPEEMIDETAPEMNQSDEVLGGEEQQESEEEQIGPVWDSYTDNMKSVAQEVTKGLRVEDVVEPPTEYHYAAFGKPDPFVAPMLALESVASSSVSGLEVPIVSPLQRHEISALKLVGIWQLRSGERKALILTPSGGEGSTDAGIIVRNGDSVGNRAGKILAIGDSFLTVREFRLAADGTRQYEDIQMLMGAKDPSATPGKIRFTPGQAKTEVILEGETPTVPVGGPAADGNAGQTGVAPMVNQSLQGMPLRANTAVPAAIAPSKNTLPPANSTMPAIPPAIPAQPIGDLPVGGIAPVSGDKLPNSMNGTGQPTMLPTSPPVQSPELPAPKT